MKCKLKKTYERAKKAYKHAKHVVVTVGSTPVYAVRLPSGRVVPVLTAREVASAGMWYSTIAKCIADLIKYKTQTAACHKFG